MKARMNPIMRGAWHLAALSTVCLWPLAAQSQAPIGSYGFLINEYRMDTAGQSGGAAVGVMNIDEAGKVTATVTFQGRDTVNPASAVETGRLSGTYTNISEGVGILELTAEDGFRLTLAVVTTDNGQALEFISPTSGAGIPVVRGSDRSLNGGMMASLLIDGVAATDVIPLSVRRSDTAGSAVFTGGGSASGKMTCQDGSTGDWTVSVDNLTIALRGVAPGPKAGDYLLSAWTKACGDQGWRWTTLSGLVTGSFAPTGSVLRLGNNGSIWSGTAKAIQGRSLGGLYGLHSNFWPFPGGQVAVLHFDGEGGVRGTFIASADRDFGVADRNGTYSIQDDGSGTLDFNTADGQPGGPSYSIVVVDNGAGFLYLRRGANVQGSVMFGSARAL